ncbi:MAG: hypothetical protein ACYS7M_06080 [Planctomycetota bacterium]
MCRSFVFACAVAAMAIFAAPAQAEEPDPNTCLGVGCDTLPTTICDVAGFEVTLTDYIPAEDSNTGSTFYTYEICSPPEGVCTGDGTTPCLDHGKCLQGGNPPGGTCTRECAADEFSGLSHFNIDFPDLGGESCLTEENFVGGSCACTAGSSGSCSVDSSIVLGDGSCYSGESTVAKCDETNMAPGDCIEMELEIAGESNELGLGVAIVVSKESQDCNESCLAGPSCERCDDPNQPGGNGECLTRTLGFWGTHPWITNDYAPVTVCGETIGCYGASDGLSNPSCPAGTCESIMEALGSAGGELKHGSAYVSLIRQLTAAKLNLAATDAAAPGAFCSDWTFQGKSIQAWLEACEANKFCNGSQSVISEYGCIEALDNFNNSLDTGFPQPPAGFDRPPVDDFGNISGADPRGKRDAKQNGIVIGRNVPGGVNCN